MALPDYFTHMLDTAVVWGEFNAAAAPATTKTLSLNGLLDGAAKMGASADLGSAWQEEYYVQLIMQPTSAPTAGNRVDLYLACSYDNSIWPAGMIQVTGGTSTHYPTVIVRNCRFHIGENLDNVTNLFDPDSDGYVQVLFENNWELANDAGPVNAGLFYRNFRGLIELTGADSILSGGYLHEPAAVASVSTHYTAKVRDYLILVNAASATVTVTLPPAVDAAGQVFVIKKVDSTGNVVTIDADAAETIDGSTTQALSSPWDKLEIACDGAAWFSL